MSNTYFTFKQFTVHQDKCAMKVGTDGVLLGAWTPVKKASRILDVGTGTGVIALMLAQRNRQAHIIAIEIEEQAAMQAQNNVECSPWAERIKVVCCNFQEFHPTNSFDLIVSNPPYFVNALQGENKQRNLARHTNELSYEALFRNSVRMLARDGVLSIIIPAEIEEYVMETACKHYLYPVSQTQVYTKFNKPCRRVLLNFSTKIDTCIRNALYIENGHGEYTPEYITLTRDFYLKM